MRDEMRIERITLNNYRQYYGKVVITFTTKENAFSIIVGDNGAGKSNLWNAIHWCLFNEEPHLKSIDKPPIINKKYLQEKNPGFLTTSVEIIMVKGKDKYLIKRSLSGQLEHLEKDNNGVIILSKEDPVPAGFFIQDRDKSELFQISENGGEWETKNRTHDFKNLIYEHIIPKNLAKFFILDGEFLQDLFNEFKNIQGGIDQISQINVLKDTIKEVHNVKFNLPKGTGQLKEIEKNIEKYNQQLASEDNFGRKLRSDTMIVYGTDDHMHEMGEPRKNDIERSIRNMKEELLSLNTSINNSNAEVKSSNRNQYATKLKLKKSIYTNLEGKIQDHIGRLVENGPLIMCKSSLDSAATSIKKEMDTGKIPNTAKRLMIKDLLEKQKCLCGAALKDGTDSKEHVECEMKKIADQVQYDIANDIRSIDERFLNSYESLIKDLDDEQESIRLERKELDAISEELKALKQQLDTDDTDYGSLLHNRDTLTEQIEKYQKELGRTESEIEILNSKKGDEIRKYNTAERHARSTREAMLTIKKAELIKDTLEKIKQDVEKTIRNKVASETLKIYNNMSWKKNYEHLQIDNNYQISIRGEDGMDIVGGMAAGEKLFLALSFIMALKKITDYRFPFVIDSPLGKAGGNLKVSFGKHMPKLLDGSQMIMLATNTEYNKDKIRTGTENSATHTLKELLEQNGTVHEHEIDFNKEMETARVMRRF